MEFLPTALPNVILIKPRVFAGTRGFFMETWEREKFALASLDLKCTNFYAFHHGSSLIWNDADNGRSYPAHHHWGLSVAGQTFSCSVFEKQDTIARTGVVPSHCHAKLQVLCYA